ncbi:MAG: hypothetical protein EOS83_15100 [Mesorhizobium sp.]|nr:MAG: hypothetical protein EOS83_15100 [Mesorhizobium sp.]
MKSPAKRGLKVISAGADARSMAHRRLAEPRAFVIPVRSKERSDAAQTLGSVPLPWSAAAVQNL